MRVVFETAGGDVNLKDLGTGVEQLLMTLTVGLTDKPPQALAAEEPETNLHQAAQRARLGFFQDWAAERQIIVATHSPVMLDWSPGGHRLWLVTRDHGESHIDPVEEDPLALLRSLGIRPSDVLVADRLLVVEGPSDEDLVEAWFSKVIRSPRVAITADGGDNALYADRFARWLAEADRTGIQKVLYMRDRDELPPSAIERLTSTGIVSVLSRRELENYLLDPEAITAALRAAAPETAPSADDVLAAITAAAETLRRKVIVNRVCRQLQFPRPMDHKLRQQVAEEGADADRITAAVSGRLAVEAQVREQVDKAWADAQADVDAKVGADLLAIAPGEEILDAVFMRFAGRHYRKRDDGPAIARGCEPPAQIAELLSTFLPD